MGRPRAFQRGAALRAAMLVFWEKEYAQTSIRDLAGTMGIGLPSLYAAFGDKRSLFDEAVDLYKSCPEYTVTRGLGEPSPVRQRVGTMLRRAAIEYTDPSHPRGCLLINEPLLVGERQSAQQAIRDCLASRLGTPELPAGCDVDAIALFYGAVLRGLSAQARDGATREQLLKVGEAAMAAWPSSDATGRP